jgi:hypothetical protein
MWVHVFAGLGVTRALLSSLHVPSPLCRFLCFAVTLLQQPVWCDRTYCPLDQRRCTCAVVAPLLACGRRDGHALAPACTGANTRGCLHKLRLPSAALSWQRSLALEERCNLNS